MMSVMHANLFVVVLVALVSSVSARVNAVAVFRRDEVEFHKYSAVLAAIEPFRLQLAEEVKQSMNPITFFFHHLKGTKIEDPESSIRIGNRNVDAAYARYESRIDDIVRSYGMTVDLFNTLSYRVMKDTVLKKKVLLQAYYYRIAADLETNTKPDLPLLPAISTTPLRISPEEGGYPVETEKAVEPEFSRFCKALRTIENERLILRDSLQRDLRLRKLPLNMCDPDIKPLMCKQVQAACDSFPVVANRIINFYGLKKGEFDSLYEKTDKNIFFRIKVRSEIDRIDREKGKKAAKLEGK